MASINAMKKKLSQLEAEKAALSDTLCPCRSAFLAESSSIIAKVSETTRRNADARKYALGGALLKLAATDPRAYEVLKQAWAMGQKDKPRAFEDVEPPYVQTSKPTSL